MVPLGKRRYSQCCPDPPIAEPRSGQTTPNGPECPPFAIHASASTPSTGFCPGHAIEGGGGWAGTNTSTGIVHCCRQVEPNTGSKSQPSTSTLYFLSIERSDGV